MARAQQPAVLLVVLKRHASLPGAVGLDGSVAQQLLTAGHASSAGRWRRGEQRPGHHQRGGQSCDDVISHDRCPFTRSREDPAEK